MTRESIVGPDDGEIVRLGPATVRILEDGATVHDAPAGTLAMIPPGAPHTFANPGDEPLVLLNTFTPDLYVQYFRDLRELAGAGSGSGPGGAPTAEAVGQVMSRYATEVSDQYADE